MVLAGAGILIIGASHLAAPGSLAIGLNDALLSKGAHVHSLGVCGVSPSQWSVATKGTCGAAERFNSGPLQLKIGSKAQTVPIQKLIETEKPTLVIVVMGDTLADYQNTKKMSLPWVGSEVDQIVKKISDTKAKCIWVGPSWGEEGLESGKTYARVQQVSSYLSQKVAPCRYIDSLTMSRPGEWITFDGLHYLDQYYTQWGSRIADTLKNMD